MEKRNGKILKKEASGEQEPGDGQETVRRQEG